MRVYYSANQESLTFGLSPRDRERYPRWSQRIMLAFNIVDWPPRLGLLSDADKQAVATLLTGGAETEGEFSEWSEYE